MSALAYWVIALLGVFVLVIAFLASDVFLVFVGTVMIAGGMFFAIEDEQP